MVIIRFLVVFNIASENFSWVIKWKMVKIILSSKPYYFKSIFKQNMMITKMFFMFHSSVNYCKHFGSLNFLFWLVHFWPIKKKYKTKIFRIVDYYLEFHVQTLVTIMVQTPSNKYNMKSGIISDNILAINNEYRNSWHKTYSMYIIQHQLIMQ